VVETPNKRTRIERSDFMDVFILMILYYI